MNFGYKFVFTFCDITTPVGKITLENYKNLFPDKCLLKKKQISSILTSDTIIFPPQMSVTEQYVTALNLVLAVCDTRVRDKIRSNSTLNRYK